MRESHSKGGVRVALAFLTLLAACDDAPERRETGQAALSSDDVGSEAAAVPQPYYDRGDRLLWRDDFAGYEAGAFPARMALESGHAEVRWIDGRNFLWSVDGATVVLVLSECLPERFSIEFEYELPASREPFLIDTSDDGRGATCKLGSFGHVSFVDCDGDRRRVRADLPAGGLIHPRFTVDGEHVSGYINEQLLPALPDALMNRGNHVRMSIPGGTKEYPTLITVINVAEGGQRRD